ncbi:MAG TPA: hypothetical protein VKB46_18610, partial [Pyrinomonadaceae bacterium]|nr:hypothetical protein [Pyrinomonadaceae bacterium]
MSTTARSVVTCLLNRRLFLALALSLLAVWLGGNLYSISQAARERAADDGGTVHAESEFVNRVPVFANDVVYNPVDQMLYVSVPSSVGPGGNSIVSVNPTTGVVGTPVFVGSEPGKLSMSDDGHTLYVFLEGAYAVRRYDTLTQTPGQRFTVGQDSFFGVYRAGDLAVAPGNPNLVAVARYYLGTSPLEAGVAVFDNGVQRTTTTPGHIVGANSLAFSASETKLYGGGDQPLETMTVNASGVTIASNTSFNVGQSIKFADGRIYSSSGQVVNPDTGVLLGTFSGTTGTIAFVPDPTVGRAYYVVRDFSGGAITLKAYDINTFVQVGSATLAGITGDPTALVRWGTNGLALRTSTGQLQIIRTSLIPSADPSPTPTPPLPTPTPTPTPVVPTFIRKVTLPNNDMVINPTNQQLYLSVPSSVGARGNSVT